MTIPTINVTTVNPQAIPAAKIAVVPKRKTHNFSEHHLKMSIINSLQMECK